MCENWQEKHGSEEKPRIRSIDQMENLECVKTDNTW